MVTPLVTSLQHFHQCKLFQNMVCILALFGVVLGTFKKVGQFFSKSSGFTLAFPVLFAINLIVLDNDERSSLFLTSVFGQTSFIAFSCGFLLMASLGSTTFCQITFSLGLFPLFKNDSRSLMSRVHIYNT